MFLFDVPKDLCFSFKNSPVLAGLLCWGMIILGGSSLVEILLSMIFRRTFDPANIFSGCALFGCLFITQLFTGMIIAACYKQTQSIQQRKLLILVSVLHGVLMVGDISIVLWLNLFSVVGCVVFSIILFLFTGSLLAYWRHRAKAVIIILFTLVTWIQPLVLVGMHQ